LTEPAAKLEQLAKAQSDFAAVGQVLAELQALADRLVVPEGKTGQASTKTAVTSTSSADPVAANQPSSSATIVPLVSRLADNRRLHGVIQRFIDKLDDELKAAQTALERGDLADLARIAHWLKGAGGTVGYDAFTKPAARLEALARSGETDSANQELERIKTLSGIIVPPTAAPVGARRQAGRPPVQAVNSN
jgi:HPt (histidine-containing phosphotransfer) domain-containing protein